MSVCLFVCLFVAPAHFCESQRVVEEPSLAPSL